MFLAKTALHATTVDYHVGAPNHGLHRYIGPAKANRGRTTVVARVKCRRTLTLEKEKMKTLAAIVSLSLASVAWAQNTCVTPKVQMDEGTGSITNVTINGKPVPSEQWNDVLSKMCGIGVLMSSNSSGPVIERVFDDAPAQKAGLRPGDTIIGVDGEATTNRPLRYVVQKIRGDSGTLVTLRFARDSKERDVTIERAVVRLPSSTNRSVIVRPSRPP